VGSATGGIQNEFDKSTHSLIINNIDKELPVCIGCHPAHSIVDPKKDDFRLSIMSPYGKCHIEISSSYFDTYHGKASVLGSARVVKCHDCHNSHSILPLSHYNSSLSRNNIFETCYKCHPGANKGFTRYLTHATHHDSKK